MMDRKVITVGVSLLLCLGRDIYAKLSKKRNAGVAKGRRIVILGAGFAGVEAGKELARLLPDESNGEIVLVSKNDYLLFTPMLTEVVGGTIEPHHIIVPLQSFSQRIKRIIGEVKGIDLHTRTVFLEGADTDTITADQLIICLGSSANYHHVPGAEENAVTMKTLEDAYGVRQSALSLVKAAAREGKEEERKAMLTFVVAGGGYTGVETIAALNELVRESVSDYTHLDESEVQMVIAEPTERLMAEVTPDLAAYSQEELERAGIRVLLKTGVKSAHGGTIELTNGEQIRARTFIWTAGVEPNTLAMQLPAPKGHSKGLQANNCLALENFSGVWAVGDNADVPQPKSKSSYGATAQNATREGKLVARNVVRQLKGKPLQPFTYTPIGQLALVGRYRGVALVYGFKFSGLIAWAMWRAVYLAKMPSLKQRLRVLADWCMDLLLEPVGESHFAAIPSSHTQTAALIKSASTS
ncbi:MAG: NAD(P)/FAD-dependent oxidoreductase [Bryobacteraceae bacterium]